MNKLPIAAAGIVAMLTTSVLFAYAEPSERVIPAQNDAVHYCRTNLQDEEQLLYDALLQCALSEDPTAKGTEFQVNTDPASDAFRTEFRRSYNALLFDHPELFWLAVRDSSFQYSYRRRLLDEGAYYISFQLTESFPERDAWMQELESAADAFLSEIDLDMDSPHVALQIHDKLIDLVTYDVDAASSGDKDLAHTAYGALVANSSGEPNSAVCDGYSYAYEYLLQKAGIRSTVIAGWAGESGENAGPHSWNLVELSGDWYEVDATWNDISAEENLYSEADYSEIAAEAMRNEWYTNRLKHYLFNVTTEQISYFEPGSYYRYSNDRGWVSFLGESIHLRHTQEESTDNGDYMTPLAPIAEGVEFSYPNLTD
jgi:hypothetical protein